MTRNPDKFHLSCAIGELITATGINNGSGATVAHDLSGRSAGPGLPPPFAIVNGRQTLSIAVGYPAGGGGSFVLALTSNTGDRETYTFTQFANVQDGAVIELTGV